MKNYDFDLHIEAKRSSLRKFINDTVQYFLEMRVVPTMKQVYDYISTDRWAKVHFYDGTDCRGVSADGFECIPIEDLCQNIINLCSFNLDDVYEESVKREKRLRIRE